MLHVIDTSRLPYVLRTMFRCPTCRSWYSDEDRTENCQRCFWGLAPDMKLVIKRKAVVMDLAQVAEKILAVG